MLDDDDTPAYAPPRPVWLTTEQVQSAYGFDPTPFSASNSARIRSKLAPVHVPGIGSVTTRLWLADDVAGHPEAVEGE